MKTASDRIAAMLENTGKSIKSIVKILLSSRRSDVKRVPEGDTVIIMGNGPSLRDVIDNHADTLHAYPTLAVNFAANAPEYTSLRPRYYVLADPHFFNNTTDPNVARLIDNLNRTDWQMTLFLPATVSNARALITSPTVDIQRFNAIAVEGWEWLENAAYSSGRGMPRPRNVLIPSIMIAMRLGYRNIFLTGADHSWMRTLEVNDNNEVVSVQPHFYKEDAHEEKRVVTAYRDIPLHSVIQSFYVAFRAYHDLQRYAASHGINIYNATPGSFIDAFPRRPLP